MYLTGAIFVVWLVPHGLGGWESVPIVLAAGAGIGAANGLIIILLRVPPVVATLATFFVLLGVDLAIAPIPSGLSGSWVQHLAGSVGTDPRSSVHTRLSLSWFGRFSA